MIALALAAGLGGVVGAAAALAVQASRVARAADRFGSALETCLVGRHDETCQNARARFAELRAELADLGAAWQAAKRALWNR